MLSGTVSRNDEEQVYIPASSTEWHISHHLDNSSFNHLINNSFNHLANNSSFTYHPSSTYIDATSLGLISPNRIRSNQALISRLNKPIT